MCKNNIKETKGLNTHERQILKCQWKSQNNVFIKKNEDRLGSINTKVQTYWPQKNIASHQNKTTKEPQNKCPWWTIYIIHSNIQ